MRFAWLPGLLYCCFLSTSLYAVNATVARSVFYRTDTAGLPPYLDLCWQIDPASVHYFKTTDSNLVGHIRTDIVLRNDKGIVHEEHYMLDTKPQKRQTVMYQNIFDSYRHSPGTGTIHIELTLSEEGFGDRYHFRDSIHIASPAEQPFYSSLQLIDTVLGLDVAPLGKFTRNGEHQIPLAADFFDERRNTLHYYLELYHGDKAEGQAPFTQSIYISKKPGSGTVYNLRRTDTIKNAASESWSGTFGIAALPSGNYYLNAELKDATGKKLATQEVFFQRLNPNPAPTQAPEEDTSKSNTESVNVVDLNKGFMAKYTTEQIKAILKMLLPLADPTERDGIRSFGKAPDDTYMRYFIINFFTRRNPDDPKAEWEKYSNKVRAVNKLFNAAGQPGYETDRGYIYLKYGEPTERVIVRNEQSSLPYEVWIYNSLPRMNRLSYFLFYQPANAIGNYELLHSTVPDERRNTNWRSFLFPTGQNPNARAEQYLGNR